MGRAEARAQVGGMQWGKQGQGAGVRKSRHLPLAPLVTTSLCPNHLPPPSAAFSLDPSTGGAHSCCCLMLWGDATLPCSSLPPPLAGSRPRLRGHGSSWGLPGAAVQGHQAGWRPQQQWADSPFPAWLLAGNGSRAGHTNLQAADAVPAPAGLPAQPSLPAPSSDTQF